MALADGLGNTRAERVLNTSDGDESHVAWQILVLDLALLIRLEVRRRPRGEVAIAEGDGTEGLVGAEDDSPADVAPSEVVYVGDLNLIGSRGSVLVHDDMLGAALREDLAGTLRVEAVLPVRHLDDDTHSLAFAREGDHMHDLSSAASGVEVGPVEILRKLEKSRLSLAADEDDFPSLGILVLESCGVDGDGFVKEMAERREGESR